MDKSFENTVVGCRQVLLQGRYLLDRLTDTQYASAPQTYLQSSIGQHFRHIFDLWFALINPVVASKQKDAQIIVDYDRRRRGAEVESKRSVAMDETSQILAALENIKKDMDPHLPLVVLSEVGLDQSLIVRAESTLARELVFVSSHATHHFALIGQVAALQGVEVAKDFGVAPATRSYLRETAE